MAKTGVMAGATKAASRAAANAAVRPRTIAERGEKSRGRGQAGSDPDNDALDELEDAASSSSSSVIVRKQHASDKYALMSAQQQEEHL
jgi:hypothetical protein